MPGTTTPANIELTDNSRIKDGQKLKVSFFHAAKCYDKANMTMEDPAVYPIMEKDVNNCAKVWNPFRLLHALRRNPHRRLGNARHPAGKDSR